MQQPGPAEHLLLNIHDLGQLLDAVEEQVTLLDEALVLSVALEGWSRLDNIAHLVNLGGQLLRHDEVRQLHTPAGHQVARRSIRSHLPCRSFL